MLNEVNALLRPQDKACSSLQVSLRFSPLTDTVGGGRGGEETEPNRQDIRADQTETGRVEDKCTGKCPDTKYTNMFKVTQGPYKYICEGSQY